MEETKLQELFPAFSSGPLSSYRKKASFDWRKLKLAIDGEEIIQFKNNIWSILREYDSTKESSTTLSMDEQRILTQKRVMLIADQFHLTIEQMRVNPKLHSAWCEAIFMYDLAAGMGYSINHKMFTSVLRNLSSGRHDKTLQDIEEHRIVGCFALTEIAHGSNAKGMRTTATHDPKTKEFILHSENFEAAKCWAGLLGKRATHALVYAKLITSDGKDQGLHTFLVPVRCTKTLNPLTGIVVGDMGEKMALNGVDNGFLMFNSYRIPEKNLLNALGDVDESGNYFSPIENPNLRFAISLSVLSSGRVQITLISSAFLQKAITIAIRYSAVRKQFGPENSDVEFPVLEYQQQQFRLIPYLSASIVMGVFSNWFLQIQTINDTSPRDPDTDKYMEVHALSSAAKPIITWTVRDGIQVCREACGGHGYLKATGIGDIRSENDANCTYEGENSLLLQQASNWLLNLVRSIDNGKMISTPYGTVDFINDFKNILNLKVKFSSVHQILDVKNILDSYKWLICYTLRLTSDKIKSKLNQGKKIFAARNESQSFYATSLSVLYAEYSILRVFYNFALDIKDRSSQAIMLKLASLYGAWSLEKHLGTLYIGGYFSGDEAKLLRNGILELCETITSDAIPLVDTIAPPDHILNSVLGSSNGLVYQNLQSQIFSSTDAMTRPKWWRDIVNQSPSSKL